MDDDEFEIRSRTLVNGGREYQRVGSDNQIGTFDPYADYEHMEMDCE